MVKANNCLIRRLDVERARRNGEMTPAVILDDLEKHSQSEDFEGMVCLVVEKDKSVYIYHTDFYWHEIVGLLQMAIFGIQTGM